MEGRQGRPSMVSRFGLTRKTSAPCSSAHASSLRVIAALGRFGLSDAPMRATVRGEKNPSRSRSRSSVGRPVTSTGTPAAMAADPT